MPAKLVRYEQPCSKVTLSFSPGIHTPEPVHDFVGMCMSTSLKHKFIGVFEEKQQVVFSHSRGPVRTCRNCMFYVISPVSQQTGSARRESGMCAAKVAMSKVPTRGRWSVTACVGGDLSVARLFALHVVQMDYAWTNICTQPHTSSLSTKHTCKHVLLIELSTLLSTWHTSTHTQT